MPKATAAETHARYVAGIAATGRGIKELGELARSLPWQSEFAYVILQTAAVAPDKTLQLEPLRGFEDRLRIVTSPEPLVIGYIYAAPAGFDLVIQGTHLRPIPQEAPKDAGTTAPSGPSAEMFLRSMSATYGRRGVAVVLAGEDDTLTSALADVQAAGGFVLASAENEATPNKPVADFVRQLEPDFVLRPEAIGERLLALGRTTYDVPELVKARLYALLSQRVGRSHLEYRADALERRVHQRMVVQDAASPDEYLKLCEASDEELNELSRAMLVPVTSFFRDLPQFLSLARALLPLAVRSPAPRPRIWVAGCSTGQEAYSIAMLAVDAFGGIDAAAAAGLEILATDVDELALERAAQARYPRSELKTIPEPYRSSYTDVFEQHFEVRAVVKDFVRFEVHDLSDPPPVRAVDLVSLRNVLIHFEPKAQRRVLTKVHDVLRAGGLLFMGETEQPGTQEHRFEQKTPIAQLFQKPLAARPPAKARALEDAGPGGFGFEDLERANEELRVLSNRLQATNEELQTANGALEASNVKLQAANQELVALSEDLLQEVRAMQTRDAYDTAFFHALPLAALHIDATLSVLEANLAARRIFDLTSDDVGPWPLSRIQIPRERPTLISMCRSALEDKEPQSASLLNGWRITVVPYALHSSDQGRLTLLIEEQG